MDPISRLHQSPINHAHEGRGQGGTPGLADDSRQWLGSPPAALCCRPRPLALLYNMWVFIYFYPHHPPSTTLASRRTAVRFGRLVVDGPPPLGPSTTPSTMRSRRPDEGRATSTSRPPCPSASWKNSGRTDDGTHADASTMPEESAASCVASRQVFPSTRRTEARTAPRSASSPSPPPVKGVPESSPCGSPRPGPLARPPQSRTSARAVTPFVGHPSSVL